MLHPIKNDSVQSTTPPLAKFEVMGASQEHFKEYPQYFTVYIFEDRNAAVPFLTTRGQAKNLSEGGITIKKKLNTGNEICEVVFFADTFNIIGVIHELLHVALQFERVVYSNPTCAITHSYDGGNEERVVYMHSLMVGRCLTKMKNFADSGNIGFPRMPWGV